jgi:hypothetical protein
MITPAPTGFAGGPNAWRDRPLDLAKLIAAFGILILTGCVSDRDIANDPQYPSDFRENTVYYTRVPLILAVYHGGWPAFTEITGVADSNSLPPSEKPRFMSTYKTYEMLPVGTPIRVVGIHRFYAYLDVGSTAYVDAKLASGPHQGVDVEINAICKTVDSPTIDRGLLVRNRDILSETPPKS